MNTEFADWHLPPDRPASSQVLHAPSAAHALRPARVGARNTVEVVTQ